jgi:hypothetical protein
VLTYKFEKKLKKKVENVKETGEKKKDKAGIEVKRIKNKCKRGKN